MTIAIIGAGIAGLVSAKTAKECGLEPTLFEKEKKVGGLWKNQSGGVWDSMRTNISHHTCAFSDFPWEASTEDFPNQSSVNHYLERYAEHFHLQSYLHLNSPVQSVTRSSEQWLVTWLENDQVHEKAFDHVLVCSGIFSKALIPEIPGSEKFGGMILHSRDYKNPEPFKGLRVAVVGNAFSGCEIASELSSVALSVTNIYRRTMWLMPRYLPSFQNPEIKLPLDLLFYSRSANARSQGVPLEESNVRKGNWFKSITRQEEKCPELAVDVGPTISPYVVVSDHYADKVQEGKILLKKGLIERMEKGQIHFSDHSSLEADAVIYCTGYQTELPFLSEEIKASIGFDPEDQLQPLLMHQTVFHPELPHLAFVGMYRGPYFSTVELQARWACMVFSQKVPAPTPEEMDQGIQAERAIRHVSPRPQFPHGDYVKFSDDIANQMAVLPDWGQLRVDNPELYRKTWSGPHTGASYRLTGYGANPELAKGTIDRINQAVFS